MARPRLDDAERRRRVVARHHVGAPADDLAEVLRSLVVLHSTDPATPFLSAWTRLTSFEVTDLERALYRERWMWRLHAMRRTLFVASLEQAPTLAAATGTDLASKERARLLGWLADEPPAADPARWLRDVENRTVRSLADAGPQSTRALRDAVPELSLELTVGAGRWATKVRLASRLLYVLAMDARIVRADPAGSWRSSQYRWAEIEDWFGRRPSMPESDAADGALAHAYVAAYGPVTELDVRWWTGWTAGRTRAALARVGPATVTLDDGSEGLVAPDDVAPTPLGGAPAAALTPALDATAMGWKARDWYLGDLAGALFDRNGNVGPVVWVDGAIVGGWAQRPDGQVVHRLLVDVGRDAADAVDAEAARLTAWLDGVVVSPRFRTPLERDLSG